MTDKAECAECGKTVYRMEAIKVDNSTFHKGCFKCAVCRRTLTLNNFAAVTGKFYCKTHYLELFHEAGGTYEVFGDKAAPEGSALHKTMSKAAGKALPALIAQAASLIEQNVDINEVAAAFEADANVANSNAPEGSEVEDDESAKKAKRMSMRQRMKKFEKDAAASSDDSDPAAILRTKTRKDVKEQLKESQLQNDNKETSKLAEVKEKVKEKESESATALAKELQSVKIENEKLRAQVAELNHKLTSYESWFSKLETDIKEHKHKSQMVSPRSISPASAIHDI